MTTHRVNIFRDVEGPNYTSGSSLTNTLACLKQPTPSCNGLIDCNISFVLSMSHSNAWQKVQLKLWSLNVDKWNFFWPFFPVYAEEFFHYTQKAAESVPTHSDCVKMGRKRLVEERQLWSPVVSVNFSKVHHGADCFNSFSPTACFPKFGGVI